MISVAANAAYATASTICAENGRAFAPELLCTAPANGASVTKSARIASARSHV